MSLIHSGHVIGVLAGPPCETWSAARNRALEVGSGKGQRPLRSVQLPFGMQGRTAKELTQVEVGNALLTVALRLFTEMISAGGFGLVEHPASAGPAFASIFKLEIVQRLRSIGIVRLETFAQGLLGQISPKPTSILTLRLPSFAHLFKSFRTNVMPPPLRQINENGEFFTAAAQTYQPRFCALIGALILDTVHRPYVDVLRHAFVMREVVSKFKRMLIQYDAAPSPDQRPDFVLHNIDKADIPQGIAPLLDWFSTEQTHGADYHGPLHASSSALPSSSYSFEACTACIPSLHRNPDLKASI